LVETSQETDVEFEPMFNPRSVVVVGVSDSPSNLATNTVRNLQAFRYPGAIHAVGRTGDFVGGLPIHRTLDTIPDGVELAVILTPARTVPDVLEQCGRKGIRHAIVQSGGFKELGEDGAAMQVRMREIAGRHGIRFSGPNGLGILVPSTGLAVLFVPIPNAWRPGGVAVAAQSGGVGVTYLYHLASENLGLSHFVSMGNKLDLDEADFVRAFAASPEVRVAALYLEGIERGREFFDAVRESPIPVVVQKSGRTALSRKIAFSHTAALAQDDRILDAALRQAGAVRASTTDDVMNALKGFLLPPVKGKRVAVCSRSGGHAVIGADAAADNGFELPEFPESFLQSIGTAYASSVIRRGNPLDLGDVFDFRVYAQVLEGMAAMPDFDAVVMVHEYYGPWEGERSRPLARTAAEMAARYGKPVALVMVTDAQETAALRQRSEYPVFSSVESAFSALGANRRFQERRTTVAEIRGVDAPLPGLAEARERLRAGGPAFGALSALGLAVPAWRLVRDASEVPDAFEQPVALKVVSAKAVHKTDAGGVRLGIQDAEAAREAVADFATRFGPFGDGEGVLIQDMADPGIEMFVGGVRDPSFGPVVVVGVGGVLVEVLSDTVIRLAPVTEAEAGAMISGLRGAVLLSGVRGKPPADAAALARIASVVSRWMAETPEIEEIDLNPVLVHPHGATVVDARVVLECGGLPPL
jgi:acetyltransferase